MTATAPESPPTRSILAGRWIDHWDPEDAGFWRRTGAGIANRNLWFSILSEHIGFSIWTMWSVLVLFVGPECGIDAAGTFLLVAVPTFVGAILRLPYTFAVGRFGGRNWTVVSAALLLIPTVLAAIVLQPGTSYISTQSGDLAYWSFLAVHVVCAVVTYAVYVRPVPVQAGSPQHPRLAYAGV